MRLVLPDETGIGAAPQSRSFHLLVGLTNSGEPHLVRRPGLDPGTLRLKGTFHRLFCVGLVARVYCFQGIVLF